MAFWFTKKGAKNREVIPQISMRQDPITFGEEQKAGALVVHDTGVVMAVPADSKTGDPIKIKCTTEGPQSYIIKKVIETDTTIAEADIYIGE